MYIFLARNNIQAGPYTLEQVNQMLADGQVALDDLMWHEGMDNWQAVGEMTHGQLQYQPAFQIEPTAQAVADDEDYIINNTPTNADDSANQSEKTNSGSSSIWDKYAVNNPHKQDKNNKAKTVLVKLGKQPPSTDISHAKKQLDLASVGSRIVAKLVDLFLLFLPTMILFASISSSPEFAKILKLAETGISPMQYSQQMNDLLANAIPQHLMLITNLVFWGVVFLQGFLLARRGQTLGKMLMRIRVLDIKSNAIPSIGVIVFLRASLFVVAMLLMTLGLALVALLLIGVDFIMMMSNADRQSLHDKLAKTYVVRADDTQTTPLELKPDA